jgi:hypothetical protein
MRLNPKPDSVSSTKWVSRWRFVNLNLVCRLLFPSFHPHSVQPLRLSPAITDMTRQTLGVRGLNFDFICVQLSLSAFHPPSVIWLYFGTRTEWVATYFQLSEEFTTGVYKCGHLKVQKAKQKLVSVDLLGCKATWTCEQIIAARRALRVEALCSFKTVVPICRSTRRCKWKDKHWPLHPCADLRSDTITLL